MDAGDYETNTLLIDNLSAISFRIYEPIASQSSAYTFNASDVEDALRSDGHLVYMDSVRYGIWCFYLTTSDNAGPGLPERIGLHARMEVCGYPLGLVSDGNLDFVGLLKNRPSVANHISTPNSSSSTGSGLDMRAHAFGFPPTPVVVEGKVASMPAVEHKGYSSVPAKEIHEFFITAVLSSLTAHFCRAVGAILLNHRTVLLPQHAFNPGDADWNQAPRASALATFRVYLTTTGSLVVSLHVSALQGLVSSDDVLRSSLLHAGPTVLAAPFGTFGHLQGVVDTENQLAADGAFGQSPDAQVGRLRSEHNDRFLQWKMMCLRLFQMRGMSPSLLDGCSWLNVHFFQRKPYEQRADGRRTPLAGSGLTAPWPAVLCFRKPKIGPGLDLPPDKALPGAGSDTLDPLNRAKLWCQGSSEREDAIARKKKEREAEAEHPRTHPPQVNGCSPIATWRGSAAAAPAPAATPAATPAAAGAPASAPGIMYPTPPDGMPGVTPSVDGGAAQSPPGHAGASASGEAQRAAPQSDAGGMDLEGFSSGGEAAEPKHEHAAAAFHEENLFGDLGEDMFEGNELTDADFNFFDEQPGPEEPMDVSDPPETDPSANRLQEDAAARHARDQPAQPVANAAEPSAQAQPAGLPFAKPELRHARSTLAEESRRQTTNAEAVHRNAAIGHKRQPSPFNPETVFKRVRASIRPASPPASAASQGGRRPSIFDRVEVDPAWSMASRKYAYKGLFDYRSAAAKSDANRTPQPGSPFTTGCLLGSSRQRRNLRELPPDIGTILARLAGGAARHMSHQDDAPSDSGDSSSASSDEDETGPAGRVASSPAKSSAVRRRLEDDVMSMAASMRDLDNMSVDSPAYTTNELAHLSASELPEFSISKYFADPEPVPLRISVSDDDFITVAQILAEQAACGVLKLAPSRPTSEVQDLRRSLVHAVRYSVRGLQSCLPRSLEGASRCKLRRFTEVQDVPLLGQPHGRAQLRPADYPKPNIFPIPTPHVELRRNDSQLSVLPSAVGFWDTLGLGPAKGPKNVVAVCVVPPIEGIRDDAAAFLDRVQSTYESMRLGAFERLSVASHPVADGVAVLPTDHDAASPGLGLGANRSAYTEHMAGLAKALAGLSAAEKNFVVYFAYAPENPSSVVDGCSAFQELFEHYKRCMADRKKAVSNELALQLVPLDSVASDTSLVVLSPSECARLCLETYDRCTLFGGPMPSPAVMLEKALPRGIDFKLVASPSPSLLRENSYIHVAYARSVDERWVSAAWTDNRGSSQSMASYCLGRRGRPMSRTMAEVIHEIWETTYELVSTCKVHWRVVVAKSGPMEQYEAECWTSLAQQETRALMSLVLLTVDSDPSLQLVPLPPAIPDSAPAVFYGTPASTPQPFSVLSPDQSANNPPTPHANAPTPSMGGGATTPADSSSSSQPPSQSQPQQQLMTSSSNPPDLLDSNGDTTIVDTTETTWGVVVSHRLNNSPSLTDLNPALASGYLVKRAGPRQDDCPVAMEVNVIYGDTGAVSLPGAAGVVGPAAVPGGGGGALPGAAGVPWSPRMGQAAAVGSGGGGVGVSVSSGVPGTGMVRVVASSTVYDALLREMLTYFRGLGTLARARGVVEKETDVRPWHVAVVEKAVRALYLLM
ncbi:hypothetical protein VTJ83DRAFT_7184 [Remersonia thermophila]|uniref:Mediator of RNA polymerase II transcription subunit 13 n=1 Tax=Remersonia thermophila TaxID=72144 RepID=A0ABR4D513_9PEZI